MVTEPAHEISGVIVVIGMTSEGCRVAKILAIFSAVNGLVDRIHRLENFPFHTIVNAKSPGFAYDTVPLQEIRALLGLEGRGARQNMSIHIEQATIIIGFNPNGSSEMAKLGSH